MKGWLTLAATALLAGCATSPIPAEQADQVPDERLMLHQETPTGPYGTLTVTRDTGITGSACNARLSIDGELAAEIAVGETASFFLSPGEHVLGVITGVGLCPERLKETAATIIEGEAKRYRISLDLNGSIDLSRTAF